MTVIERNSEIWHTIFIGMFSADVKYMGKINDTLRKIRKKIDDQIPFYHSMEIGKGIARESLLHFTDDGILFSKTVEVKYVVLRINNMLWHNFSFTNCYRIKLYANIYS